MQEYLKYSKESVRSIFLIVGKSTKPDKLTKLITKKISYYRYIVS